MQTLSFGKFIDMQKALRATLVEEPVEVVSGHRGALIAVSAESRIGRDWLQTVPTSLSLPLLGCKLRLDEIYAAARRSGAVLTCRREPSVVLLTRDDYEGMLDEDPSLSSEGPAAPVLPDDAPTSAVPLAAPFDDPELVQAEALLDALISEPDIAGSDLSPRGRDVFPAGSGDPEHTPTPEPDAAPGHQEATEADGIALGEGVAENVHELPAAPPLHVAVLPEEDGEDPWDALFEATRNDWPAQRIEAAEGAPQPLADPPETVWLPAGLFATGEPGAAGDAEGRDAGAPSAALPREHLVMPAALDGLQSDLDALEDLLREA
jgi:hypothetical protein